MTEINKIDLLKIDAKLQARRSDELSSGEKSRFEDQLLQTVKQLENIGSEIDAMMLSNTVQINPVEKTQSVLQKSSVASTDSVVENFSAAGKASLKSAKSIAAEYESMNQKKQS